MTVLDVIKYIETNSEKGLLETTRALIQHKLQMNVILLIDNHDKSKVIGRKTFKTYTLLENYIANLPMKYGYAYFYEENSKYFSGASFYDQGWMCEYDRKLVTITDYYDEDMRSVNDGILAYQLDLFEVSSKIKVVG